VLVVLGALAACGSGSEGDGSSSASVNGGASNDAAGLDGADGVAPAVVSSGQDASAGDAAARDALAGDETEQDASAGDGTVQDALAGDEIEEDASAGDGTVQDAGAVDATSNDATADAGTSDAGDGDGACGDPATNPITITGTLTNLPAGAAHLFFTLREAGLFPASSNSSTPSCGGGPNSGVDTYPDILQTPAEETFTLQLPSPVDTDGTVEICGAYIDIEVDVDDSNYTDIGGTDAHCGYWGDTPAEYESTYGGGPAITSTCVTCNLTF
jgi:hypothetical protein